MMELPPTSDRLLPAAAPAAARAAISPSALVLAGAGTAVGLLAGLPALAAVAIGAGFWGVRVAVGAALAAGRRQRARRPEVIDPYAVPEPWRSFVRESLTAQARFDEAVKRSHPGPLRDRLAEVAARIHDGVRECWRVAHLGAAVDAALSALDPEGTSTELRRLQDSRRSRQPITADGPTQPAQSPQSQAQSAQSQAESLRSQARSQADDDTEAAMAARLQAARRVQAAAQRATDRLRVLTAELNAAVAGAVELSLDAGNAAAASRLAGDVDSVVGELQSLRRALEETTTRSGPTALPG